MENKTADKLKARVEAQKQHVKKIRKSSKPVSLKEFRAWLAGVEEMQPPGWVPSAEQWETIRHKIGLIEEAPTQNFNSARPQEFKQAAPPAFSQHAAPAWPVAPAVQAQPPQMEIPPDVLAKIQALNSGIPPEMQGPDGRIKTPDIDTSGGTFKSPFE